MILSLLLNSLINHMWAYEWNGTPRCSLAGLWTNFEATVCKCTNSLPYKTNQQTTSTLENRPRCSMQCTWTSLFKQDDTTKPFLPYWGYICSCVGYICAIGNFVTTFSHAFCHVMWFINHLTTCDCCHVATIFKGQLHKETLCSSIEVLPAVRMRPVPWLDFVLEIAICLSHSPQHSWWRPVLVETHPVQWQTLHNI